MSPEFEKLMKDLREEGLEEGMEKGMETGRVQGMVAAFSKMIKKGLLTISDAAKDLNMSEKEFRDLMPA